MMCLICHRIRYVFRFVFMHAFNLVVLKCAYIFTIGDLETIFRLGQCDTRGCILCVSLAVRSARTPRWKTALSSGKTTLSKDDDLEEEEEEDEEEDEEEEEENTAVSGAGCSCAPAEGEKESSDVFEDDAQRVRCLVSNLVCVCVCVCVYV